jgi:alkaline phosphatase
MYEAIAADFLKTDIDLFIGGGKDFFAQREDGRNLIAELKKKGYRVFDTLEEASEVKTLPLAILTSTKHNRPYPERGEILPQATEKALELLSKDDDGFFIMVEGSQIDWGGHENNTAYIVKEMLDFDRAIGKALNFAARNKETLVIVTADHETGGMSINGGDMAKGQVSAKYTTGGHTAVFVPIFSFGPGAEKFSGIMDNTDIFFKMRDLFGF